MKRSDINKAAAEARAFFADHQFHLPVWIDWTLEQWQAAGKECDEIRMKYKNHADLYMIFYIYGVDGQYYLDICDYDFENNVANHQWFKIKPEYVVILTSAILK